jgi:hypothetical protein
VIAHAGGWDELLVLLATGLLVFAVMRRAGRRGPAGEDELGPEEPICQYCGQTLGPEETRCPSCGLKVRGRPGSKRSS